MPLALFSGNRRYSNTRKTRCRTVSSGLFTDDYFAKLTRRRLKRGIFRSVTELQAAIKRFLAETNAHPRPFRWTKDPDKIFAAVKRGHQVLDFIHSHVRHFKL